MDDHRRFGVADGLILIAGVGVGLGVVRSIDPGITRGMLWRVLFEPSGGWSIRYALQVGAELCVLYVTPFLAAWTPACLLVQLKEPRARRLRRAPGFLACLWPSVGCALTVALTRATLGTTAWTPRHAHQGDYESAQVVGGFLVGSGVMWAWATLAACGLWRPRSTWTDRLGRLTGAAWVVVGVLNGGYVLLLIG